MAKKVVSRNAGKLPPVQNDKLKEVIQDLKKGSTPERQQALMNALKNARLLSPVDFDVQLKPDTKGRLPRVKPSEIRFFMLNTNDGKMFFPVFTDFEESTKFKIETKNGEAPKNVVRTVKDYDRMLSADDNRADGIVINPGSDNIVIPKMSLGLLSGRIKPAPRQEAKPVQITKPVPATYGEPAVYPTRMVNAVYDHCTTNENISRVWLKEKKTGPESCFLFLVEMDRKDQAVLDGIKEVAEGFVKETPVEVDIYTQKAEEEIIKGAVALYDRVLEL